MIKTRISILDGFRALAIVSVLLFHFFSRWIPPAYETSLYPYNNAYNYFSYGYLGVQFFFIISGFVIFFTLDNTTNFSSFWKKRLIRLLPSIVIASLITFTIFRLFDYSNLFPSCHEVINFIPSLTFISPTLLNNIFSSCNLNLDYINGSYWSLWPEIQFYLFSSVIYYISKDKFIRNFLITSIILIGANYMIQNINGSNKLNIVLPAYFMPGYTKWIQKGFNLINYLPFFSIGVLFYLLFKNNQIKNKTSNYVKISFTLLLMFSIYAVPDIYVKMIYLLMFLLFFIFIYLPGWLAIFENKTLTNIGESSYFLYLIHESIGVLIIYSVGPYLLPLGFVFPVMLIIAFAVFSNFYTKKIDKKICHWLKMKLIKP